jgi:hypothetical protein
MAPIKVRQKAMPVGERVSRPSEMKRKDDPQIVPNKRNL